MLGQRLENSVSSIGSVEIWLQDLQEGHVSALGKLHQRYWPSLVAYARTRLRLNPRAWVDEEDIVQSAFLSFYRGLKEDRAPLLASRENLLALLTTIIARKAARKAKGPAIEGVDDPSLLEELAKDPAPSPLDRALVNDCYLTFVGKLPDKLRPFAEMSLAGMTQREIAAAQPCALRTVERKMARIFLIWQEMAAAED